MPFEETNRRALDDEEHVERLMNTLDLSEEQARERLGLDDGGGA